MKKQEIENQLVKANQLVDEAIEVMENLLSRLEEDEHDPELIEVVDDIKSSLDGLQYDLNETWNKEDIE